jgi:hypothetical protein
MAENVEVTGPTTTSCLKWILSNVLYNVTYALRYRQAGNHFPPLQIYLKLFYPR